jgi:2-haloacid dehalogenase
MCRSYKPSQNNFRMALGKLGVAPEEVVHIAESRYHDIAPARQMGIRSVWVNRSRGRASASGSAEAVPDLEVHSLSELVAQIV